MRISVSTTSPGILKVGPSESTSTTAGTGVCMTRRIMSRGAGVLTGLAFFLCVGFGALAQSIPPSVAPILLNLDRSQRTTAPLDQNTLQTPTFYIGDDVALQINLLAGGLLIPTNQITAYTNLTVMVFLSQNDTNAPQMSNSVISSNVWTASTPTTNSFYFTNLTASAFTNGAATFPTNGQIMLYWPGSLTQLNLNGQSSAYFWMRCYATGTNGATTTFGEGPIQALNAPITALSPPLSLGNVYLGVSNTTFALTPTDSNFFAANSNLLNASVPTTASLLNSPHITTPLFTGPVTNSGDLWVTNGTLYVSNSTGSIVATNGNITASGAISASSVSVASIAVTNASFTNLNASNVVAASVTASNLTATASGSGAVQAVLTNSDNIHGTKLDLNNPSGTGGAVEFSDGGAEKWAISELPTTFSIFDAVNVNFALSFNHSLNDQASFAGNVLLTNTAHGDLTARDLISVGNITASSNLSVSAQGLLGYLATSRGTIGSLATGPNSDLAIGNYGYVQLSGPGGAYSIAGFVGGFDGRYLIIENVSGQTMQILNQSGLETVPANRITTTVGGNVSITGSPGVAMFVYDGAASAWKLFSSSDALNSALDVSLSPTIPQTTSLNTYLMTPLLNRVWSAETNGASNAPIRVLYLGDSMSGAPYDHISSASAMVNDLSAYGFTNQNYSGGPAFQLWNSTFTPAGGANPPIFSNQTNWWTQPLFGITKAGGTYSNAEIWGQFTNVNKVEFAWFQTPYGDANFGIMTNGAVMATVNGYAATFTPQYTNFSVPTGTYFIRATNTGGNGTNLTYSCTAYATNVFGFVSFYESAGSMALTNTAGAVPCMLTCQASNLAYIATNIRPDLVVYHAKDASECGVEAEGMIPTFLQMYNTLSLTNAIWVIVGTEEQATDWRNGWFQNSFYRAMCATNAFVYVDSYMPPQYYASLSSDGVHPSQLGANLSAGLIESQLGLRNAGNTVFDALTNGGGIMSLTGYNYATLAPVGGGALLASHYYTNTSGRGIENITLVDTATIAAGALSAVYVFQANGSPIPGTGYYATGAEVGLGASATNTISFPLGFNEYFALTNLGNSVTIVTNWLAY